MTQREKDENDYGSDFNRRSFPDWDSLYAKEEAVFSLPWYNKELDDDLREQLSSIKMTRGKRFLDLGTGPATQAIELCKLGFQVTATDISENAISRAKSMTKEEEGIEFIVDDILDSKLKEDYFDCIFDRGCFHVLEPSSRQRYVKQVSRILRDNGLLFLKTFSIKEPSQYGPYRFSIDGIKSIFSNKFEIALFKETVYQGTLSVLPRALFVILSKKDNEKLSV
jgi:SAM-dependent methyltransferase